MRSGHHGVGADAKICACAVRISLASNKYSVTLRTQLLIHYHAMYIYAVSNFCLGYWKVLEKSWKFF